MASRLVVPCASSSAIDAERSGSRGAVRRRRDIPAAKEFYAGTLGLNVTEENGMLMLHLAGGVPEVMLHLRKLGLLDTSVLTVTGSQPQVTIAPSGCGTRTPENRSARQ